MALLAKSYHIWITFGLFILFCLGTRVFDVQQALIISNALLTVTTGVVAVVYLPKCIKALRRPDPRLTPQEQAISQHISYGIVLGWGDTFLWRLLIMVWLLTDQRRSLVNNYYLALLYDGASLGAFYHLTSPNALARSLKWRIIACTLVVVAAAAVSAVLLLAPPDLTWLADAVEPWLWRH